MIDFARIFGRRGFAPFSWFVLGRSYYVVGKLLYLGRSERFMVAKVRILNPLGRLWYYRILPTLRRRTHP